MPRPAAGAAGSPEHSSVLALLAPAGARLLTTVTEALAGGESELHLATRLRADHDPAVVAAAITQVELRARASAKFARADEMLFTRAGLEQASGERAATHRARRLCGHAPAVADLCCGIGGDLVALARFADVLAVDRDEVHLALARHNAEVYGAGARVTASLADVRDVDLAGVPAAMVDPARRSGGRRLAAYDVEPPLEWCFALPDVVPVVAVKSAPGIDLDTVPRGWEVEFVADGRDLKEAVLWSPGIAAARTRATVLPDHELVAGDTSPAPVGAVAAYVLDPSPAVTRAGLVAQLAHEVGGRQIDERIAFVTADTPTPTAFGRWLRVEASLPWRLKSLAAELRRLDVGAVDLRRRGLAGDVEDIRRRLRLDGTRRATVLMTRVRDEPWAIVGVEPRPDEAVP